MKNKILIVTSLVILLSFMLVKTALADMSSASSAVSYSAFQSVSYTGPIAQMSFAVNVTLDCGVAYSCLAEGSLPPSSPCHLNVTPSYAQLTIDYHVERYQEPNLDGIKQLTLSIGQLSGLVGDSQPFNFSIDSAGNITIIIRGTLIAQNLTVTPQGSANPNTVQWSTWTPQDTLVSSINSSATLKMDTKYAVSFSVLVSMVGFTSIRTDSTVEQFLGNVSPAFVIPEFPSTLIITLFMIATLLTVIAHRRKRTSPPMITK
jgi:hypothetical protein